LEERRGEERREEEGENGVYNRGSKWDCIVRENLQTQCRS
jgi:hypothetical protein